LIQRVEGVSMKNRIEIKLREFELEDLDQYLYWNHPTREFHKFNGPYYKPLSVEKLKERIDKWREEFINGDVKPLKKWHVIVDSANDELIGIVTWYWKSEETKWMEIGIVVFNENYWGHGIGYAALEMWMAKIFNEKPEIVRLGLTTWSGNKRMMKLSEKLGMKKEAEYRNARIVDGEYYDSVSYGILREEWEQK